MANEPVSTISKKHSMILENRKQMSMSGVKDVSGFDEQCVNLITELGDLCIKGEGLHISDFSRESGELNLDGEIDSMVYSESRQTEGGFFSKLFK